MKPSAQIVGIIPLNTREDVGSEVKETSLPTAPCGEEMPKATKKPGRPKKVEKE